MRKNKLIKLNKYFFGKTRVNDSPAPSEENQDSFYMLGEGGDEDGGPRPAQQGMPFMQRGIVVEENNIYLYSPIGDLEALDINKALNSLDRELQMLRLKNELTFNVPFPSLPINLYIQSPGGDAFAAFSIIDTMKNCKSPIHTYVMGEAASAATLIACAGTKGKRFISKNSFMLFHQQRLVFAGKLADFKDEAETQDAIYTTLTNFYLENSNIQKEELEKLLKRELFLPAQKCVEYGFVDQVL